HVRAGVALREASGELRVDLDGGEAVGVLAQVVRGRSVAGADLEQVGAEVGVPQDARQDLVTQLGPPLVAGAELLVPVVHPRRLGRWRGLSCGLRCGPWGREACDGR